MSGPPPPPPPPPLFYRFGNLHLPTHLRHLIDRYTINPRSDYYRLDGADIINIDPAIVAGLNLIPGRSTVLNLHPNYRIGLALLELIRHANVYDDTRPSPGVGPITAADIQVLQDRMQARIDEEEDDGGPIGLVRRDTGLPPPPAPPPPPPPDTPLIPAHIAREQLLSTEGKCPISYEEFADLSPAQKALTSCGHLFERSSIKNWLETNPKCPDCREACMINPADPGEIRQLVGRNTVVHPHLKPAAVSRAIRKNKIPPGPGPHYVCKKCGKVLTHFPESNKCERCGKTNAFMGGSRKCNKKNSRRKSKKLIKRKKTMKRR